MKKIIALAAIAALSTVAQANGFYIGGDVGKSRLSDAGISDKDTSYSIFGGYSYTDTVAFELGYRDLYNKSAKAAGVTGKGTVSAVQLSALLSAPINTDFSVYGRLGVNYIRSKGKISSIGYSMNAKGSDTRALFGVGARYALSKEFGLRAEFQKPASNVKVLTFGADYRF
jgi:OOP family OmpA-OmpF porin